MINREDIKSVKYRIDQAIQKSIASELNYESSVKIEKTGGEIKEKLKQIILDSVINKNRLFSELDQLVQNIGESPTQKLDEYELKGFRKRLTVIPYKYDYGQIYSNQPVADISYQDNNPKCKYNNLLREYIDLSVDCIVIKTVIDNINDTKKYSLNVDLTAKLGF